MEMGYRIVHHVGTLDKLIDILFVHRKYLSDKHAIEVNGGRLKSVR
jgi:hypothetical protein